MTGQVVDDGIHGRLVLIRHGQTPCTLQGRFCGSHDPPLTRVGERMAELAAGHHALDGVRLLVSSPAGRARRTAEVIGAARGLAVTVDERLRELAFGDWEDLLPADVPDPAAHRRWIRDPALFGPPNGESGLQAMARAVAAVRDAVGSGGTVAVVSHKAPIRLVLTFFLGLAPSRYREITSVTVGSVSHVVLRPGRIDLKALGDVSHLPQRWRPDPDRAGMTDDGTVAGYGRIGQTVDVGLQN